MAHAGMDESNLITDFMKLSLLLRKMKLLAVLLITISLNAYSQIDTIGSINKTDTLKPGYESSSHSLDMGIGYGSNMIYMGSTISHNQPFGYTALSYGFNNEFYATIAAVHLSDVNPVLAFYTGSLNYNHAFNSWFDISAGAYRYQVPSSLADTLFRNFTYGDIALGIDWRLIYSKLSVGALLSDENQTYLQIRNSRYFQTKEFSRRKFYISFDPYINLLAGPRFKVETTTETYLPSSPLNQKTGSNIQNTTSVTSTPAATTITTTNYHRDFGLIEIDFGLPVSFNSGRISAEAEPGYVLPLYKDPYFPRPKGFVFIISCFFRIF